MCFLVQNFDLNPVEIPFSPVVVDDRNSVLIAPLRMLKSVFWTMHSFLLHFNGILRLFKQLFPSIINRTLFGTRRIYLRLTCSTCSKKDDVSLRMRSVLLVVASLHTCVFSGWWGRKASCNIVKSCGLLVYTYLIALKLIYLLKKSSASKFV